MYVHSVVPAVYRDTAGQVLHTLVVNFYFINVGSLPFQNILIDLFLSNYSAIFLFDQDKNYFLISKLKDYSIQ